jgi:hypothetical protein
MPTYTTVVGWTALIALGAFFYYTWPSKPAGKRGRASSKVVAKPIEAPRVPKAKRAKKDGELSSGDQASDRKKKTKPPPEEKWSLVAQAPTSEPDDEVDNREFARQLTSAKAGTTLTAKAKAGTKQKSVKQGRAQEKPVAIETSSDATGPSSAAGGDADDDASSFNSPELIATTVEVPVTNGGISDMLQAPAPGPSVLRVTARTTQTQPRKAQSQAAPETTETKKQRQNRKKAELKKVAREEEEKERKALLEKQRRTAREADGRAAKDGSAFMAAKAPANTAWTAPAATTSNAEVTNGKGIELLDTFSPSNNKTTKTAAPEIQSSGGEQAGSDWQKLASTLPEEEQLRLALEDSDNWETVQTKEKRKGKKATQAAPPQQRQKENQAPISETPSNPPTGNGKKWETHLESSDDDGNAQHYVRVVQDSEWEVA